MNFLALPKCGFGLACKMCSFLGSRCQSRGRNRGVFFFCLPQPQAKYLSRIFRITSSAKCLQKGSSNRLRAVQP